MNPEVVGGRVLERIRPNHVHLAGNVEARFPDGERLVLARSQGGLRVYDHTAATLALALKSGKSPNDTRLWFKAYRDKHGEDFNFSGLIPNAQCDLIIMPDGFGRGVIAYNRFPGDDNSKIWEEIKTDLESGGFELFPYTNVRLMERLYGHLRHERLSA